LLATQVVISLFFAIVAIQLLYYFGIFSFFILDKKKAFDVSEEVPTSILIAAKNEAVNLQENLPFFLNQRHRQFEIILIDDHSTDDTYQIMMDFKQKNPSKSITVVRLQNNSDGNKKLALTKGISVAKYPNLLFTDADCKPKSDNWINLMTHHLVKKDLVLGYGAYQKIAYSWLNKLIRFETVMTALQYFSYAKIGLPYMGVGRNMAYKKALFTKVNGFENHLNIKSGDDDLFVNEVATKKNTSICYNKEAHTISKVHTKFKKWLHQKKRHITTATSYKPIHQFLLGLYFISNFLFWVLGLILILFVKHHLLVVQLFAFRLLIQYFYLYKTAKKLDEKDLVIFAPLLELFLVAIQFYLFISNLFVKPKSW
jgi:glycosyltransferase involved in cell wall biosynthesis